MSIKPILFNTEMVRAILGGRKTVTRRVMNPQPYTECDHGGVHDFVPDDFGLKFKYTGFVCRKCGYGVSPPHCKYPCGTSFFRPPYNSDDILYARETWRVRNVCGDIARGDRMAEIEFKAGGDTVCVPAFDYAPSYGAWNPSIHMPKEAARLFLRVKHVSVERLQDIDIEGIRAEGLNTLAVHAGDMEISQREFAILWDFTIKPADLPLYGWDENPWVWVIEFERCEKPAEVNCNG